MSLRYRLRIGWIGWWYRTVFSRLSGQRRIVAANLKRAFPKMDAKARKRLEKKILKNVGRNFGELVSLDQFLPTLDEIRIEGPGRDELFDAIENEEPLILVTGHVGNYVAGLHVLNCYGVEAGFLYRTRGSGFMDRKLDEILKRLGQKGFKISHRRRGRPNNNIRYFIEFMGEGNTAVMLADHRDRAGARLDFLGHTAPTSLTPAKLALKYDAHLIPVFVLRQPGGKSFRIWAEEPIEPSNPAEMMQVFNDLMSDLIREDPAQWSWTLRRW